MPKTILTIELPCIPRAITTNTAAKSKVTIKSPLSVIGQIKNWLTKSDQDVFKHYSQLGRLLDLDTKGLFPGTLVNQIVLRRVDCQKRHELWFLINGKPVRFSLQEFAIVSGLYTDGGPTPEEMELVSSKNKLKEKYFKNMMSIKVTDVANALDSISRESKTRDGVKLCFIYLLSAFLIMPSPSSAIDLEWLQLIWICEAMPKLGEMVGQRVPGNHIPRWLGWKINDKHKNVTVIRLSEVIENNTEFFVRPTLAPTSKEKAELFYERLGSYEDNEDDIIDQISSFLVGDVILRNQQCVAPHVAEETSTIEPIEEDVQAFFRWYNGDTNGRRTIRCGQTSHDRSCFEILLAKQRYIDSEHVDEITYLFRKRMDKFHNVFPKDICILTDEFGQRVRALYKESREENNNVCKTNEELMMFGEGTRPIRGRIWSDVNYFYVPWNDDKHWMLVVVDRHSWTILIYDSIPDHWISIEAMKKSVEPLAAYFPFLLKNSCHIGSLHHQCSDLMSIKVAPANTVPLNKRTGDCGIFMLKTMEMHIAGKCNESATMLLNDDNIDTYRKAYAVQLYVGSADP
ncbi:hypothetical protein G4B88_013679 [Cannabis sativa]|uniref:Ubiquitin-like protease family profile domain-containing protein n=1 Tax=Cannabis sativa TaxID=3483 RepID=A0A7J6HW06_CANSA|nr:hypothetical protein G4B88_013679 [Cannabis sativa]